MQQGIVFNSIEDLPEILNCSICKEICVQPTQIFKELSLRRCEMHTDNQNQVGFEQDRSEYKMLNCKCKYCGIIKNAFKIQKHQSKCQDIYTKQINLASHFKVVQNDSQLKCNDCEDIPFLPLNCVSCQQLICFICRINHKCSNNFILVDSNIIKSIQLVCSLPNCNIIIDLNTALNHYKKCELKFRLCPGFQKCQWMGNNKDYNCHKQYCQHTIYCVQNLLIEAENQFHEIKSKYLQLKFLWDKQKKKNQLETHYLTLLQQDII